MDNLKSRLDVRLLRDSSRTASAVEMESPYSDSSDRTPRIYCYIARKNADVRMHYIRERSIWLVVDRSEVIQFSGCEFDGQLLLIGRFYFQTVFLSDGKIVPKKKEFIDWGNRVFRLVKDHLRYSKSLHAYVGEHADKWKAEGGRFAWMVTPERGPLYAE